MSYQHETESSPWGGIQASLSEMERRLIELQDQLDPRQVGGAHGAMQALATPVGDVRGAGAAPTSLSVSAADGQVASAAMVAPVTPVSPAGVAPGAGFVPAPFGSDPAARQSAGEIIAQARTAAREVLAMAEAQVGLVKEQIEQLLAARETLRASLRTSLAECGSVLEALERGDRAEIASRSSRAGTSGAGGSLIPGGSITPEDIMRSPGGSSVFEGSVSLRVGPLRDISQVDTLEIALLQVPGAELVEVKEFAGRDAVAVIKLFQAVPLVEELRRVLPFQFEVAESQPNALTLITVEDGEDGSQNGAADSRAGIEGE